MVRTTLNLEPAVLTELKRRAKRQRRPLGEVASEELARAFEQANQQATWPPPGWTARDMGPCAIDLSDGEALWEFLDRETLSPPS